jgi:hypothetical protein
VSPDRVGHLVRVSGEPVSRRHREESGMKALIQTGGCFSVDRPMEPHALAAPRHHHPNEVEPVGVPTGFML